MPPRPLLTVALAAALAGWIGAARAEDPAEAALVAEAPARPAPSPPSPAATTPSPTPATLQVERFDYVPPLSVTDCIGLMGRLRKHVEATPGRVDPARVDPSVPRVLESIYNYLSLRNDLHASLNDYTWIQVGRGGVAGDADSPDTDRYRLGGVVEDTSALSFEAERTDVEIHSLKVIDESGAVTGEFTRERPGQWTIRAELPRRDVFQLWKRRDIREIEVTYAPVNAPRGREGRLAIYAGRTSKPEYGKITIYEIDRARRFIREGDMVQFGEALEKAERRAHAYRDSMRPGTGGR
ncbi:MAG: hypothetical protein SF028_08640 [Candidatus Sumerlaeia bacterium]|nr:hypothetical protein [Candidatus Sumerlaeia bacterium]